MHVQTIAQLIPELATLDFDELATLSDKIDNCGLRIADCLLELADPADRMTSPHAIWHEETWRMAEEIYAMLPLAEARSRRADRRP